MLYNGYKQKIYRNDVSCIRKIAFILLVVGALVGLSPLIGQLYTKYQEQKMIDEWLNSEDAVLTEGLAEADPEEVYSQLQEAFASENGGKQGMSGETAADPAAANAGGNGTANAGNAGGAQGTDDSLPGSNAQSGIGVSGQAGAISQEQANSAVKPASEASKQNVLGIIRIKKIKVVAPIVEGVQSSNLKVGVGHIPGTAAPGQPGNSALAGHRSYTFGKFFNRLDEMVIGDEISITTKKEDLKFEVYKIHTVKPEDVSVLRGSKDESIITLITCTPIYVASHRLIVQARLTDRVLREP